MPPGFDWSTASGAERARFTRDFVAAHKFATDVHGLPFDRAEEYASWYARQRRDNLPDSFTSWSEDSVTKQMSW